MLAIASSNLKMKLALLIIMCALVNEVSAQGDIIVVKAQRQEIKTTIDDDNNDKVLVLNASGKNAAVNKLTIYNGRWQQEKDWNREFVLYDERDNSILKLSRLKNKTTYEAPLKELFKKLNKDQTYLLYTIATPADQQKAATIRVRRVLICRMMLK